MHEDEFFEKLYAAIEESLRECGSSIRPSWIMKYIVPVIKKYIGENFTKKSS